MGAVLQTIQATLWAEKKIDEEEEGWILRVHAIHLPRGTWRVVWNSVTMTPWVPEPTFPPPSYDPFVITSVELEPPLPPGAVQAPESITDTQFVMVLNNTEWTWNEPDEIAVTYKIHGPDSDLIFKIYDPTIIVGTDPVYVPPGV